MTWNEVQHELDKVLGKSVKLIDRLKLAREVKSTALDGKLFQISTPRSEKNDDLAVHEQ